MKLVDYRETGANRMIQDCLDYGLPEPEFRDTGTSIVVIFRRSKLTEEYLEEIDLNNRQKEIIGYLKEYKSVTSSKYAERFNITKRTALSDLKDLVKKGITSARGKGKRKRHYILTEI